MGKYKKYDMPKPGDYGDYMPDYRSYDYAKPDEQYSDQNSAYASDIARAQGKLNSLEANKPGAYNSAYAGQISDLINNLSNRKFSYDVNGDAMYQQYKNTYMNQGKQAMEDAMGQASAMTGGYGSSYAAAVGNQAYQSYLDQLNDKIPELRQMALSEYNTETSDLQNLYSILADQEQTDYGKYRDTVSDYQTDRSFYDSQLNNLRGMAQDLWGKQWENYWSAAERTDTNYNNALNAALTAWQQAWKNFQWGEEQTQHNYEQAVSEDQWKAEQDEAKRQHNDEMDQRNKDRAEDARQSDADRAERARESDADREATERNNKANREEEARQHNDEMDQRNKDREATERNNNANRAENARQHDDEMNYKRSTQSANNNSGWNDGNNNSKLVPNTGSDSSSSSNSSNNSSSSSSGSKDSNSVMENSKNVKNFKAGLMTPNEFDKRKGTTVDGKKYTNYKDYVIAVARNRYNSGKLTADELKAILSAYQ